MSPDLARMAGRRACREVSKFDEGYTAFVKLTYLHTRPGFLDHLLPCLVGANSPLVPPPVGQAMPGNTVPQNHEPCAPILVNNINTHRTFYSLYRVVLARGAR